MQSLIRKGLAANEELLAGLDRSDALRVANSDRRARPAIKNKLFRAKIKQASSRLGTMCQPPPASEADLTDLALRMCERHGIAPRVTAALAIEAGPRREDW